MTVGFNSSDKIFHVVCNTWLVASGLIVLYPLIYVVSCSISNVDAVLGGRVILWPVDISIASYKRALEHPLLIKSFFNSLLYVVGGTAVAVTLILLAAYPLSRRDFPDRKIIQAIFVITMFFGGGLIPGYLLMRNLHLVGSRLALIIGAGFSCYNMIIIKTYFQNSLPPGLLDAAHIDGCGDVRFFFEFAIPLSIPVIAVMVLFNTVGIWNGYFNGLLYLNNPNTFTFQQVLRDILFIASASQELLTNMDPREIAERLNLMYQLRYAILVIGAFPMMILYPFIQKYFIRGMMIGSLKE
jgi:ABC-type glycerol-3-phosphate transport system permease component